MKKKSNINQSLYIMCQKYNIYSINNAQNLHHIAALSCLHVTHGPAADLGVNLRDEVKQKAWGSLGGWGERQGRNADQGEMERPELLRSPVQHLIRKKGELRASLSPLYRTPILKLHTENSKLTHFSSLKAKAVASVRCLRIANIRRVRKKEGKALGRGSERLRVRDP